MGILEELKRKLFRGIVVLGLPAVLILVMMALFWCLGINKEGCFSMIGRPVKYLELSMRIAVSV